MQSDFFHNDEMKNYHVLTSTKSNTILPGRWLQFFRFPVLRIW